MQQLIERREGQQRPRQRAASGELVGVERGAQRPHLERESLFKLANFAGARRLELAAHLDTQHARARGLKLRLDTIRQPIGAAITTMIRPANNARSRGGGAWSTAWVCNLSARTRAGARSFGAGWRNRNNEVREE